MKPGGKKDLKKRSKARVKRDVRIAKRKRTEGVLWESEERYRLLFENSLIGIGLASREGKVISANKAMQEITGYSEDELKKINLADTYENPQERKKLLDELKRRGNVINCRARLKHKDGTSYDTLLNISQVQIGGEEHLQTICIDITERKEKEDELRKSEATYRRLFESSQEGIAILDVHTQRIIDANPFLQRLSGRSLEQLLGKQLWEIESFKDFKNHIDFKELRRRKSIRVEPFSIEVKEKGSISVEIISTFYAVNGREVIQCNIHDITELMSLQQELERNVKHLEQLVEERTRVLRESEEKYRALVNNLTDVVFTIDLKGNFTFCSPAGEKMTGYPVQQLLSMNMREVIAQEHLAEIQERLQARMRGEKNLPPHEFEIIRADGKRLPVEMSTAPVVKGGSLVGIQGIARDITERKEMDRLREQATTVLMEDAVRRKELEKMKDQFISAVTHELRTPLVSMKGYVDLALSAGPGQMSQKVESRLQVAKRNTDRLLSLVNDLLDVRRVQGKRLQLEIQPTDFKKVVDSCTTEIQPILEEKKLGLRLEVPEGELRIEGDQGRLSQALMNLLSNAAKFSPEGSEVTLHVEEENESIKVQVSDRGIGIRKEDLERVFEPFAAIEKPNYIKGTGLGLSIAKGFIEAHGGRIWAESEGEGKGATFSFTIPKRKEVV